MIARLHMTRDAFVVEPETRARAALRLFAEQEIRHAPVVRDGRLVGIVTERDLLRALPATIGEEERSNGRDPLVGDVMTPDPLTIGPNENVGEAARLLLERRIHGLPVVQDGRLLGILTDTDLFEVFARVLSRPTGRRLTLFHAPGHELEEDFDLAREAVRRGLTIESLVRQDFRSGGIVTQLHVAGTAECVESLLDRAGRAGYAVLDSSGKGVLRSA